MKMKYFKYDSIFLNISLVKKYLEIFHVWKKYIMPLVHSRHVRLIAIISNLNVVS